MSKIQWTQQTWNPTTGCTKISPGCLNCYAEKMHSRLRLMGCEKYNHPFNLIRFHPATLQIPYKTKNPTVFFVNSMSDLFHEAMPIKYILYVFEVIKNNPRHIFQILTKRPEIVIINQEYSEVPSCWQENTWLGVTVENQDRLYRVEELKISPALHKFISFEPLLSPVEFPSASFLRDQEISWVIVGGETGPCAREMKEEWAVNIKNQCIKERIPFFFKQWGGKRGKNNLLEGKVWEQFPVEIERVMRGEKR